MEKIEMVYLPVTDLQQALGYYRDALGWTELWREGDSTAAIGPSDGEVAVMLDLSTTGTEKSGPILTVDDVRRWIDERRDRLSIAKEPSEIPEGWWASVTDPSGNITYLIDQSTAD